MSDALQEKFYAFVRDLQDQITREMQRFEPTVKLQEDLWERQDHAGQPGGGGRTRVFTGELFENAGVNTSCVFGKIDPAFATKLQGDGDTMWAAGISLIIHPRNPRVPTVHANFRMIRQGKKTWFGGGADLTPYYPHEEDFRYFHGVWKEACAPWDCYPPMKAECDAYFSNHHRGGEMRGIGGIFFDGHDTGDAEADYAMTTGLAKHFIRSYFPIVEKRRTEAWTPEDEDFMLHRHGRYVEFNLLHDRGTLFGLKTNGRTDSILVSLPARCKFTYRYAPRPGTAQGRMNEYFYPRGW